MNSASRNAPAAQSARRRQEAALGMHRLALAFRLPAGGAWRPGRTGGHMRTRANSAAGISIANNFLYSAQGTPQQKRDLEEMNQFYPVIQQAVKELVRPYGVPSETEWLSRMLDYNAGGVRWPVCLFTLNAMRELHGAGMCRVGPDHPRKAKVLAWCVELLISFYNVIDDQVDGTHVRWGKPCWYTLPEVGLGAVNDTILLESIIFLLLRQEFIGDPYYVQLVDLFLNTTFVTVMGMNYEAHSTANGLAKLDEFSEERFQTTAHLKDACSLYHPLAVALIACGVNDPAAHQLARDIGLKIAVVFQAQDDYDDCFRPNEDDPCGDIRMGRCTWMIVEALKRADRKQLAVLKRNYGRKDQSNVDAVLKTFSDLRLKEALIERHQTSLKEINSMIDENAKILPPTLFSYILDCMISYASYNSIIIVK